jgi:two-component system LytT family response regulator
MSNLYVFAAIPRSLFNRELGFSVAGWMLFLIASSLYCLVFNQVVLVSPSSLMTSFLWTLNKYSFWLLLTPVLFYGLRLVHSKANSPVFMGYSLLGLAVLVSASILQAQFNGNPQDTRTATARLVEIFPSQLSILCLLTALWHLFFRDTSSARTSSVQSEHASDSVRVMKGNGEMVVAWASVDFISAAGNYMELSCGAEKYLLRVTLKELEQQLPEHRFIRVHRSHIVNLAAILRIGSQQGNSFVELRNHQILPLSKSYKPGLEAKLFVPHSSQSIISSQ